MSMTVPLPVGAQLGKSFEYGIDVNLGTTEAPNWQPFRRISGFNPTPTPTQQDAQTYDDLGAQNSDITGWSVSIAFTVQVNRIISSGLYLPEVEALLARTDDALGADAVLHVRWYHKPATGTPNPRDAFEGFVTVATSRANTGPNGEVEALNVTLTSKGVYKRVPNPFTGWGSSTAAPAITAVTPANQGTGKQVRIDGTGFLGATAVNFGAVAATAFTVVSATTITATVPSAAAGSVNVTVTTPNGTSPGRAYTRAA